MRSLSEPLVSNGYTLDMTPERLGWLEPTNADSPTRAIEGNISPGWLSLVEGVL